MYSLVKIPIDVTKEDTTSFFALKVKMASKIDPSFSKLEKREQVETLDNAFQPLYRSGYKWVHNKDETFYIHPIWITILSTLNIIKRRDF